MKDEGEEERRSTADLGDYQVSVDIIVD